MLLALCVCAQVVAAAGLPLPAPAAGKPAGATPYPCQSRPCGCLTSEQCWAGDCCCFTLEEKALWAAARGVEPPAHVRPLVESRRPKPPAPKKSCCAADPADGESAGTPSCGASKPPESGLRWVAGASARRCRGLGPDGLTLLDPAVVSDGRPALPPGPGREPFARPCSRVPTPVPHTPPSPPPRPA